MEKIETLEEVAESYINSHDMLDNNSYNGFIDGYKLAQERSYNDMIEFSWWLIKNLGKYSDDYIAHFKGEYLKQWKQLKNK